MAKILVTLYLVLIHVSFGQIPTKTENQKSGNVIAQSPTVRKKKEDCVWMDFHYLILENSLWSPKVRHIEVFLDEKAFSEVNLIKLFRHLSDKNSEPKHLTIFVFTNWNQLPFPSDCPPLVISEQPNKPDEYDYHKAVFYRRDREEGIVEYFHYNPVLKTDDFEEVILKGKRL